MRRSGLALAAALVFALAAALPAAGSAGLADDLKSLKESMGSLFDGDPESLLSGEPSEEMLEELRSVVGEKLAERGIEADGLFDRLMAMVTGPDGKIDIAAAILLADRIRSGELDLEALAAETESAGSEEGETETGEEAEDESAWTGDYAQALRSRDEAIEAHLMEEYGDTAEGSDERIATVIALDGPDGTDLTETVGYFALACYAAEGADLKLLGYAGGVEYIAFSVDENLSFGVTEWSRAEEGEDSGAGIDALCGRIGLTRDALEAETDPAHVGRYEAQALAAFLDSHPAYERIEYRGEMKTAEELRETGGLPGETDGSEE